MTTANHHEQAMLCPYGCGPHQIKEGLDGSWQCPRCCRSTPLWVVAHAAYERGRAASSAEVTRLERELADLRSQANEYGRAPTVNLAELSRLQGEVARLGAELEEANGALNGMPRPFAIEQRVELHKDGAWRAGKVVDHGLTRDRLCVALDSWDTNRGDDDGVWWCSAMHVRAVAPAPASAEFARDVATVRFFVDLTIAGGAHPSGAPQALDRIEAALGLVKP